MRHRTFPWFITVTSFYSGRDKALVAVASFSSGWYKVSARLTFGPSAVASLVRLVSPVLATPIFKCHLCRVFLSWSPNPLVWIRFPWRGSPFGDSFLLHTAPGQLPDISGWLSGRGLAGPLGRQAHWHFLSWAKEILDILKSPLTHRQICVHGDVSCW